MQEISNKFPTIKERILYVLECKGIVKDKFFTKIGMTYGNFTGSAKKTPLNSTSIGNILLEIPDINLDWLISGEGNVFKKNQIISKVASPGIEYSKIKKSENSTIEDLRKQNDNQRNDIEWFKKELDKKQEMIDALLSGSVTIKK
jgi:hypothetical protein